ncbi:MAG: signal peptidase I [Anaerolineales bacterium]|jgi:signal peptidase
MNKNGYTRSLLNAIIVVMLAAIWIVFAPTGFGGTASYVIIAGASMEPTLHQGDLVIARQASTYGVGDIAAYQHPQVGPVIHRIIDREGPHYTLQGDNNPWIDSYEPVDAEILGKSWLHIPGAAEKLLWLRTPVGLSLLSLSIGLMFLISISTKGDRKEQKNRQDEDMLTSWFTKTQSLRLGEWVFPLGIVLFAAILLGLFAFTKPELERIPVDIPYTHQGQFSYRGVGSPSVYEKGQLESGQAIFHSLVQDLELGFTYKFEAQAPVSLSGNYRMFLRVSEPNGWQRTIELQPETTFQGKSFSLRENLDIQQITGIIERLKTRTGLSRQVFNVDVYVPVTIHGTLAGIEYADSFNATLPFQMDDIQMFISHQDPLSEDSNPLEPSVSAYLPNDETIPNMLNILGLQLAVSQARQIALIAGTVSLVLIALIIIPTLAISMRSQSERIKLIHSDRLVEVNALPYEREVEWFELNEFNDLIKLSESTGAMILHVIEGDEHLYALEAGDTHFRLKLHDPNGIAKTDDEREYGEAG